MLSVRFEVGVSLLLAPGRADKRGPKVPFLLVGYAEYSWTFAREQPPELRQELGLTESNDCLKQGWTYCCLIWSSAVYSCRSLICSHHWRVKVSSCGKNHKNIKKKQILNNDNIYCRDEATTALAGFQMGLHIYPGQIGIWRCCFLWRKENQRTWRKTLRAMREPYMGLHHTGGR